jgi:beta-N-acetylhexosaminidase
MCGWPAANSTGGRSQYKERGKTAPWQLAVGSRVSAEWRAVTREPDLLPAAITDYFRMLPMKTSRVLPIPIAAAFFIACVALASLSGINRSREDPLSPVDELKGKVGQLIIVGFTGANTSAPGFRRVMEDLETGSIGGVLFLWQNISSKAALQSMVEEVKHCACAAPPLIAIDEEGGTVDRLGREFGFTPTQSSAEIATNDEENARHQYRMLAQKISAMGFNLNFAPVVDLNRNPRNPVIGLQYRSYSADPYVVEKYARLFIEEHHALGILTALKHFPGHGSSWVDTHFAPADLALTWSEDELTPYRLLMREGLADMVMVGHLANPHEWGGIATQGGSTAISHILRQELKFNGVVISDALTMYAVRNNKKSFASVVNSALIAGVDIALMADPGSRENDEGGSYARSIAEAVVAGVIPVEGIQKSLERVAVLKAKLKSVDLNRPRSEVTTTPRP